MRRRGKLCTPVPGEARESSDLSLVWTGIRTPGINVETNDFED